MHIQLAVVVSFSILVFNDIIFHTRHDGKTKRGVIGKVDQTVWSRSSQMDARGVLLLKIKTFKF